MRACRTAHEYTFANLFEQISKYAAQNLACCARARAMLWHVQWQGARLAREVSSGFMLQLQLISHVHDIPSDVFMLRRTSASGPLPSDFLSA